MENNLDLNVLMGGLLTNKETEIKNLFINEAAAFSACGTSISVNGLKTVGAGPTLSC